MKIFSIACFLLFSNIVSSKELELHSGSNLSRLLTIADKNNDLKITVDDFPNGNAAFSLSLFDGKSVEIKGVYFLANLLQELKLATEKGGEIDRINEKLIFENPVDRTSRLIREIFWDGLTRVIDRENLATVLVDSKFKANKNYLYVPEADAQSLEYFNKSAKELPHLKLSVVSVPQQIDTNFLKSIRGKHGLLALDFKKPYVVPGGRFNEMYGWDSYFEALGLLNDGRLKLAQDMVDNFVYEINHYGKILNANRSYYLSRSQPPFLTSMIRAVYQKLPRSQESKAWLEKSLTAAIKEYEQVWMGPDRLTETGLSRYFGKSVEISPEVEPGHYSKTLAPYARKHKLTIDKFTRFYSEGKIKEPKLDEFFVHDQAVRESGHDTTYRWTVDGEDHCADFVTVDLNSLLYKTELDIAFLIKKEFSDSFAGKKSQEFLDKADRRRMIMRQLLLSEDGVFYDYDYKRKKRSDYVSATAFYPLWAYETSEPSTKMVSDKEAARLTQFLVQELEAPGGLTASNLASLKRVKGLENEKQWDYPNGWAPHQMIAWQGLRNYNLDQHADRLTYKWLYMITKNVMDYNGTVPEKYDVVNRSHKVFSEYGNVGTKFAYITREGFGWMNASYQIGINSLPGPLVKRLKKLEDPTKID